MSKSLPIVPLFLILGLVDPFAPVHAQPASIVLDFENADIETVIRAVSEVAGFGYVLAPDVRGKVTMRTSGPIRREDVFRLFLSILEVHGFTAVKAGDVYKIVRIETARALADQEFAREEVHVIRLQYAEAHHIAAILNTVFLGSRLRPPLIVPDARTNSLVIRARRSEVEEIGRALRQAR